MIYALSFTSAAGRSMIGVGAQVVRLVGEANPGFVECEQLMLTVVAG